MADPGRRPPARVRLSLLDQLVDDGADETPARSLSAAEAIAALRRSVQRDMEALLNARRRWRSWPAELRELAKSPLGFGIPDFAAGALYEDRRREALRAEIELTIRRFEPRLTSVRVVLQDRAEPLESVLRLRIDALLRVDPAPEPVAFNTVVDAATADVFVTPRDDV